MQMVSTTTAIDNKRGHFRPLSLPQMVTSPLNLTSVKRICYNIVSGGDKPQ